jgi:hypothetical protein
MCIPLLFAYMCVLVGLDPGCNLPPYPFTMVQMQEGMGKESFPTLGGTPPIGPITSPRTHDPPSGFGASMSLLSPESSVHRGALDASRNTVNLGVLSTGNSPLSQGAAVSRSESFLSSPDASEAGVPRTIAPVPRKAGRKVSHRTFHSRTASLPSACSTDGVCSVSVASSTPFSKCHHPGFPAVSGPPPLSRHPDAEPAYTPVHLTSTCGNMSFGTVSMYANTCNGSEEEEEGVAAALDRALTFNGTVTNNVSSDTLPLSQLVSQTASTRCDRDGQQHAATTPVSTPKSSCTHRAGSSVSTPPLTRDRLGSVEWLTGGVELGVDMAASGSHRPSTPPNKSPVRTSPVESTEAGRPPRPRVQSRPSQHTFYRHQLEDPLGEGSSFPLTRSRSSPLSMGSRGLPNSNSYEGAPEDSFLSFPRRSDSTDGLDASVDPRSNHNASPQNSMDDCSTSFLRSSLPPLADPVRISTPVFGTPPGAYPNSLFLNKAIEEGRLNNYSIATQVARTRRMVGSGSQGSLATTPMRPISPTVLGGSARMEWNTTPLRHTSNRSTPTSSHLQPPQQHSTPVVANRTFAAVMPLPHQQPLPNTYPPGGELRKVLAAAHEALSRRRASTQVARLPTCQHDKDLSEVESMRRELDEMKARQVDLESRLSKLAISRIQLNNTTIVPLTPSPAHTILLVAQGVAALCVRLLMRLWRPAGRGGSENPLKRCHTVISTWLNEREI